MRVERSANGAYATFIAPTTPAFCFLRMHVLALAIAATLLFCLSAELAFSEIPAGEAKAASAEAAAKRSADAIAMEERAIGDCERTWDSGTHMSKQDWSRTCRRVQLRLKRLDVR